MSTQTYFTKLNAVSVTEQTKKKLGLTYLPWASAYAEIMKVDPNAVFEILTYTPKKVVDGVVVDDEPRYYFTVGNSAIVKTRITLNRKRVQQFLEVQPDGSSQETITKEMWLPIMNAKNGAVPIDQITSTDWNKAIWRCFVKNIAAFGLGLHVYDGEEFSDEDLATKKLQTACFELVQKKCKVGEAQTKKVGDICKEVLVDNPDPRQCDDKETLEALKKQLLAVR